MRPTGLLLGPAQMDLLPSDPDMMLQVWRGSDLIGQTRVTPQTPGGGLTVEVAGGALYEIRLSGTRWYRIRIASPN